MTTSTATTMPHIAGTEKYVVLLEQLFETLQKIEAMASQLNQPEIVGKLFDTSVGGIPTINTTLLGGYAYPADISDGEHDQIDASPMDYLYDDQLIWHELMTRLELQAGLIYAQGLRGQWPVVMYSMWRQAHAGE